jgi:hypothetical protein
MLHYFPFQLFSFDYIPFIIFCLYHYSSLSFLKGVVLHYLLHRVKSLPRMLRKSLFVHIVYNLIKFSACLFKIAFFNQFFDFVHINIISVIHIYFFNLFYSMFFPDILLNFIECFRISSPFGVSY